MTDTTSRTPLAPGDVAGPDFREAAHRVADWIADYLDGGVEQFPVMSPVAPGELRAALPAAPPAGGESLDAMLDDFERLVLPGVTHWNHPGFFAYFAITGSAPGVLGEMLTAALNVNGMLWRTSPAATELEQHALDWLRQLIGLSEGWFGVINDTASISSLLALAAAREAHPELAVRERGLAGRADLPRLRVYTSAHSHSSIDKAAITLGIGHENVVHVPVDDAFRMRPDALARLVEEDVARGWLPIAAVATTGTTSTTSIDPVPEILRVCRAHGMWLHVDGAYGGVAGIVPELRHLLEGVDGADSLVVNPHKWLFTPTDCSAFFTRRPEVLKGAFSLVPEYLVTTAPEDVVNLMDYGVQLGRRFRALKLWFVIRAFGAEGLAERIRFHCALAQEFAGWVDDAPGWERMAPTPLSVVCFRHAPEGTTEEERNALNAAILERVNASGRVYLSHTKLGDAYTLRLAVGNLRTERRHVAEAWALLREAAGALDGEG
ncbi:MAG TPA: pyridoxal-dependent decarboxylase [Gemmatimonadaceae bacterium]|nr:pyridoxal-dependent decarboxylase [Gemmatimonadaceae bacterium]